MTPEQALWEEKGEDIKRKAETYFECVKKSVNAFMSAIKRFISAFTKAFIKYCLNSEQHNKRARIYLSTKNRRIKRKQLKLLIRGVLV
jgi:hypothetical protein